jgi:hypothetical protein
VISPVEPVQPVEPVPAESDAARVARRYPPRRAPRWLWIPLAATLGALLVLWTVWAGWHGANPPVAAKVVGFRVVSDTQIDVQVTVQRADVTSRVSCQVKALAITYDTVGQLPFTWEPTGEELQTRWMTVRTFKKAVTAEMDYCRVVP